MHEVRFGRGGYRPRSRERSSFNGQPNVKCPGRPGCTSGNGWYGGGAAVMIAAAVLLVAPARASAFTFDDIEFWVGTGANEAMLVIDWNDGVTPESLAWGYRWDGAATGWDMFESVVSAHDQLYAKIGEEGSFGVPLFGIGFDLDDDGFGVTGATFDSNGFFVTTSDNADGNTKTDADDHYQEGWLSDGFWAYFIDGEDGVEAADGTWTSPGFGSGDRVLADGFRDGLSYAPGFTSSEPDVPVAATPEPASLALVGLGVGVMLMRRRGGRDVV